MKRSFLIGLLASTALLSRAASDEWISLFDGKTMNGWKPVEKTNTWRVEDGALVAHGDRSHLFYVGDAAPFQNFELQVDCMTEPGSNGGIYFHTKLQENGWPRQGFEVQVNNTHSDPIKTGSIYGVTNVMNISPAKDRTWFTEDITVQGKRVTIKVDGKTVVDYTEPADRVAGKDFTRTLAQGTFALQGHDPKSTVRYKNIRVRRLD